jgi:AcrR family transcriptional regulator
VGSNPTPSAKTVSALRGQTLTGLIRTIFHDGFPCAGSRLHLSFRVRLRLKVSDSSAATPLRRPRGRPAKLSPALILQAATEVLADISPDQLSLSRVAEQLAAPVTSIYNYYPNRAALLSALAEDLFTRFRFEELGPDASWWENLLEWMRAVSAFVVEHPIALKVIAGVDGETSPAWRRVRAPLLQLLRRAGFEELELATLSIAVHTQLVGLLVVLPYATQPQPGDGEAHTSGSSESDRNEAEMRMRRSQVRREDLLEFSLQSMINELHRRLAARRPAADG